MPRRDEGSAAPAWRLRYVYGAAAGTNINHDGQRTSGLPLRNGESEFRNGVPHNVNAPLLEPSAGEHAKRVGLPGRGDVVEHRDHRGLVRSGLPVWQQPVDRLDARAISGSSVPLILRFVPAIGETITTTGETHQRRSRTPANQFAIPRGQTTYAARGLTRPSSRLVPKFLDPLRQLKGLHL
jgi:hypothetical protein